VTENHPNVGFQIERGFRPPHRAQVARGYWAAFSRKLRFPLGPEGKAVRFLERVLDPRHAISAVASDGTFLGVAGFKSAQGSFVGGAVSDLAAIYGWPGALVRGLLVAPLERRCAADTLLMDGIFVEPGARGQGVGRALLGAILDQAAAAGLSHVRLDVIDRNPRARALYEREGFMATSVTKLGPLAPVFGFSSATEMTRAVTPPVSAR